MCVCVNQSKANCLFYEWIKSNQINQYGFTSAFGSARKIYGLIYNTTSELSGGQAAQQQRQQQQHG